MNILGKGHLIILKHKNQGNIKLLIAVDKLIQDLESGKIGSAESLQKIRSDADKVYNSGIYFFNIHIHRALLIIEFNKLQAKVLWHERSLRLYI